MKKILYLGLELPRKESSGQMVHCPIIQTIPRAFENEEIRQAFADMPSYTHLVFTSKSSVRITVDGALTCQQLGQLQKKNTIVVGKATAEVLRQQGIEPAHIAAQETAEGVIEVLKGLDLSEGFVFVPQSSLSRSVIPDFLAERGIRHRCCILYDTVPLVPNPLPNVEEFDEIIFTSPSTVDAFICIFRQIPWHKTLTPIGPVTSAKLQSERTFGKKDK